MKMRQVIKECADMSMRMRIAGLGCCVLVTLGLVLSGCGEKPKVLRLYGWLEFVSPEVIGAFERKYGCTVEFRTYDTNEAMAEHLRTDGNECCDIIFPTAYFVNQLRKEHRIIPIDHSKCPSVRRNFCREYLSTVPEDPDLEYFVPFGISSAGFFYASNSIPKGVDVATWRVFGNPAVKGRISVLDDVREVIGMGLMALGYSANSESAEEISAAVDLILGWVRNVDHWDSEDYRYEVPSGRIWIGHGYSANSYQVIVGDGADSARPDLAFVCPKEGHIVSCDGMVVSAGCRDRDLAFAFIEFVYADPEVSRKCMEYHYSILPSAPALAALEPEFRAMIVPPPEVRGRGQVLRGFYEKPEVQSLYDQGWKRIVIAR